MPAMSKYVPTIGLEIHAELRTNTKMFCSSRNDPDNAPANTHICPVCLAHPGTLPVINAAAVRHVLRVGLAIGGQLADYTEFDRKNYFYPDLPKGYQLSQYEYPLIKGGSLLGVDITRIHLEEDTASSIHDESTGATLIDYNRAGVPLMELVTEPVIKSAEEAGAFARELQLMLRYLGASGANMEKGEMRVEANVSVAPPGERSAGYVEIKNLNSFKAMERAVAYEIKRQEKILDEGGVIEKQTLGWDDAKQSTFPQRTKEGSADYRYFPDPDLPSLRLSELSEFNADALRSTLGELPEQRRSRYKALGIKAEDADSFVRDLHLGNFVDKVIEGSTTEQTVIASNYIANDLVKLIRDLGQPSAARDTQGSQDSASVGNIAISAPSFRALVGMISSGSVTSRAAKDILLAVVQEGADPEEFAKKEGLLVTEDLGLLERTVDDVLAANPSVVNDVKAGKGAALEFLLGQCMKALRGAGKPDTLRKLLQERINS